MSDFEIPKTVGGQLAQLADAYEDLHDNDGIVNELVDGIREVLAAHPELGTD